VALPDGEIEVCAYCGADLKGEGSGKSTGWISFLKGDTAKLTSASEVYNAAVAQIKGLEETYKAQLEYERQGLLGVLAAGKRQTSEFTNAWNDAQVRLEKIWEKIREVGQSAERRLYKLRGGKKEKKIAELYDKTCDRVMLLRDTVMGDVNREASLIWDRSQKGEAVYIPCQHCGADLAVDNPSVAGEITCQFCGGLNTYSPQLDKHEVSLNKKIDQQVSKHKSVEKQFQYMKEVCVSNPSEENIKGLTAAGYALYDKQLFFIKDPEKRRLAADRYIEQAIKEVTSVK